MLDYLILDMPPGIGDATLDLIRLVKNVRFLIVTTPSQLAFETVKKLASLLKELKVPIVGIVENMKTDDSRDVLQQAKKLGLIFLEEIPYDKEIEDAIGDVNKLLETRFADKVGQLASQI
jgi:ATP-binding protein involved in chromosome partitioning